VLGVKPVRELVNAPGPEPSIVLLFPIVGFEDVFQQTPLAVTGAPASLGTSPPLFAVVVVIAENGAVVNTVAYDKAVNVRAML
jgi:hypothetical protein